MTPVKAEISGSVWKIVVGVGDRIVKDDPVVILESMKMEIPMLSPCDGVIAELRVTEGESIEEGFVVAIIGR